MNKDIQELRDHYDNCMKLVKEWGLEPFEVDFHIVPSEKMYEIASYGVPGHFSHWTYGRDYWRQKTVYDYGYSKIYELVINSDPAQAFLLDVNSTLENMFVIAHVIGHCYLPGTPVTTVTRGIQNIEEIHKTDIVFNHRGELSQVTPTARQFSGDIVTLMAGGLSFTQTSSHRLLMSDSPGGHFEWKDSSEIEVGQYLITRTIQPTEEINSLSVPAVPYLGNQAERSRDSFDLPLNEEVGELIGLYLAEGYSRDGGQCGLCFHTDEVELHNRASKLISKYLELPVYSSIDEVTHSHQVLFNSKQVSSFLKQFGRSSHTKDLGYNLLLNSNKEFLKGVLRGYLAGDGHVGKRSISFSTTSPHLAWQIPAIASMFGVYFNTHSRHRLGRRLSWEPMVTGPHSRQLRELLDLNKEDYVINREWSNAYTKETRDYIYVKVLAKSVDEYDGIVYCLNAQNGHSFTLSNGLITHNSDYFSNNAYFAHTNRNIENSMSATADRFREYELQYGRKVVEEFIDNVISISEHIDPHLRIKKITPEYDKIQKRDPYLDLFPEIEQEREEAEAFDKLLKETMFPYKPERDLMLFIAQYGRLQDWQRDVIHAIREETIYFLPQMQTKVMNEGWASLIHHKLMHETDPECDPGGVSFANLHSGVLHGGAGALNPYWLGFKIYERIISRWDNPSDEDKKELHLPGNEGWEKVLEVRALDSDESFLRNYLDKELVEELNLFAFSHNKSKSQWEITDTDWEDVRDALVSSKANMGRPYIEVVDGDYKRSGWLYLTHRHDGRDLHEKYAVETLKSIYQLWGRPVMLETRLEDKVVVWGVSETNKGIEVTRSDSVRLPNF